MEAAMEILSHAFQHRIEPSGNQRAARRFGRMPSSVIRTFVYDKRTRALDVLFVSGLRYRYSDVPEDVALGLAAAPSKGVYFNDHIRDHYLFERRRGRA